MHPTCFAPDLTAFVLYWIWGCLHVSEEQMLFQRFQILPVGGDQWFSYTLMTCATEPLISSAGVISEPTAATSWFSARLFIKSCWSRPSFLQCFNKLHLCTYWKRYEELIQCNIKTCFTSKTRPTPPDWITTFQAFFLQQCHWYFCLWTTANDSAVGMGVISSSDIVHPYYCLLVTTYEKIMHFH